LNSKGRRERKEKKERCGFFTAFFGAHESSFKSAERMLRKCVPTRIKDEQGSTWRENKLGLVLSSTDLRTRRDGVTHDIQRKEYVSCIGSVDQFKEYLLECAVRNGYGRYEQTIKRWRGLDTDYGGRAVS
jgi:hypothetical protein